MPEEVRDLGLVRGITELRTNDAPNSLSTPVVSVLGHNITNFPLASNNNRLTAMPFLGVGQGGTGGWTPAMARVNLELDSTWRHRYTGTYWLGPITEGNGYMRYFLQPAIVSIFTLSVHSFSAISGDYFSELVGTSLCWALLTAWRSSEITQFTALGMKNSGEVISKAWTSPQETWRELNTSSVPVAIFIMTPPYQLPYAY